ncbi:MAG: hypothetical protein HC804_00095 [Anaerolineae bacterium]|nr:hypothetical protein [Anaerolineae bacterium]
MTNTPEPYKSTYRINQTKFYQCHRKTLFLDGQSAKTRAGQINKKEGYRKMEAYQCNCDGCHGGTCRRVKK